MYFNFDSYKKSIISFEQIIQYISILENECLCIGFNNYKINIYFPPDFTPKINIKFNNIQDKKDKYKIFIMEISNNQLLTLYNQNILYIREIDYKNYSYKDIKIIDKFNYCYLRKNINENNIYGIADNHITYFEIFNEAKSVLKLNDFHIDSFYEIPSKKYKQIVLKVEEPSLIYFFDRIKYKCINNNSIFNYEMALDLRYNRPIDSCPFIYYEKENLLGIFLINDLIDFIDIKTHLVVYKYRHFSTSIPSIVYAHKLNNGKYFIVEYLSACFNEYTSFYLANLTPKNIYYDSFIKDINRLDFLEKINIIFARFSNSMKFLFLQGRYDENEIILYSKIAL